MSFTSNYPRIHYRVMGSGEPLILLHGFLGNLNSWVDAGYVRILSASHQLILISMRGYGDSDKPHDSDMYTLDLHASDIIAVLDQLNINQTNLLAFSMGARVGFYLLRHYSSRLLKVILGGMSPYKKIPINLYKRKHLLSLGMEAIIEEFEQHGFVFPSTTREKIMANDPLALQADTEALIQWQGISNIEHITHPVLLYVGEEDSFLPLVKQAVQILLNAEICVLNGLNHQQSFTNRHKVLPYLLEYLQQ